ncbi:unnamed protein product [Didymodactylos carnosus]|uniref:Uncharacterized protein n=1 Tax=Didymodactylos carnosus TaxID=1234261 RepID=A0A815HK17_9BILA|nr:unnamed protein product [Didymodactylos carnosus]CAF4225778.1 unnamed protein product [Didymodactylos carnosus]
MNTPMRDRETKETKTEKAFEKERISSFICNWSAFDETRGARTITEHQKILGNAIKAACELKVDSANKRSITIEDAETQLANAYTFFTEYGKETKIIDECKANVSVHEKQQYVSKLKSECIEWGLGYAHLFGTDQITPYIHVFSTHLFEFFDHFDNLNTFSLQGVERLNELLTRDYFVGSNKKGEYFRQMLKRRLCQMLLLLTRTQLAHLRDAISKQTYDVDYETPDEEEESLLDIIDFNGSFDHKSDENNQQNDLPSENDHKHKTLSNTTELSSNESSESLTLPLSKNSSPPRLTISATTTATINDKRFMINNTYRIESECTHAECSKKIIRNNHVELSLNKGESSTFPELIEEFEFETVIPCRYKIIDNYSGGEILYNGQWAFDTREEVDAITKKSRLV